MYGTDSLIRAVRLAFFVGINGDNNVLDMLLHKQAGHLLVVLGNGFVNVPVVAGLFH